MNRQEVLDTAKQAVAVDRNSSYGEPEDNFARIAKLWGVIFESDVTARQVAWALLLVKAARDVHAPHDDNLVDAAGYAACASECATTTKVGVGFDADSWLRGYDFARHAMDQVHPWMD